MLCTIFCKSSVLTTVLSRFSWCGKVKYIFPNLTWMYVHNNYQNYYTVPSWKIEGPLRNIGSPPTSGSCKFPSKEVLSYDLAYDLNTYSITVLGIRFYPQLIPPSLQWKDLSDVDQCEINKCCIRIKFNNNYYITRCYNNYRFSRFW